MLKRADGFQLVLGVRHLLRETIARGLERFELRPPCQLVSELQVDVGAQRVQAVEPPLDLLDERHARADAGNLRVELGDRFLELRGFLRALLDLLQPADDRLHLCLELGRPRGERGHPLPEGFEAETIGAQPVGQLRRVGVRRVELLHLLAHDVEVLAALPK